jgi:hypothetical protein
MNLFFRSALCLLALCLTSRLAFSMSCNSMDGQTTLSEPAQKIQSINTLLSSTYSASRATAKLASGRTILQFRHDLVLQLLREHPSEARAVMLPADVTADLRASSPENVALLESQQALVGELLASVADDFEHHTSATLYHVRTSSMDVDLFGVTPPAMLLHKQVEVSGIALDGVMAIDTITPRSVNPAEAASLGLVAPMVSAGAPPPICSTLGNQKIAVLVLDFTGGPAFGATADINNTFNKYLFSGIAPSVTTYWDETSYGQTSASGDVYNLTLPTTYDCNSTTQMRTAAIAAASGVVDFTKYSRLALVFPANSCPFGGIGNLGCGGADKTFSTQNSTIWIPIAANGTGPPDSGIVSIMAHELGHNLGSEVQWNGKPG